ncbi:MAG TPA: ABC transporter permease subunit [Candidatus Avimonas sp.]|mgnify:CR=1 FL=1|jgi:NitT/TauT family transport system permease protein|nr:ABC transporter permease subunit [Peptococcaceae bacterium MAG4]NLW38437.1 ABC transporter permease subunit [Peptococcaceae bacterium]HPU58040.1 ABC transporter permease subunit [Candidatus Avimonas sp.]
MGQFIKNYGSIILIGICILIAYILLTDVFGILSSFLFPSIFDVIKLVPDYISELFTGLKSSLYLLVTAYVLAVISAIAIGTLIGLKSGLRKNVTPYINAFSAIPVPLLTPYAINLFPTFKAASIFLIWLAAFWVILGTTIGAVMSIDKRYLETAATLEMPGIEKLFKIILPAASPAILVGCSIALTLSFMMLAVAEMFGATSGMAYFVQYYSDFARFDLVMLGFLFTAAVLVFIMYIFDKIKHRVLHWTINN